MFLDINGERREVSAGISIAGLLQELGLAGQPVAVELNKTIVPRAQHEATELSEGDALEVVQFVGGG